MNNWTGHGFVGNDPKIRTTESGKKVAALSLATQSFRKDFSGNRISDWHNLVFWEKLAELCEKYVKKGSEIIIQGEIQYRSYTDKEGVVKYITEIICHNLEFCGKKESGSANAPTDKQGVYQKTEKPVGAEKKEESSNDELNDLPFILTIPIALGIMMQFII